VRFAVEPRRFSQSHYRYTATPGSSGRRFSLLTRSDSAHREGPATAFLRSIWAEITGPLQDREPNVTNPSFESIRNLRYFLRWIDSHPRNSQLPTTFSV
jgi:hypothetical protein